MSSPYRYPDPTNTNNNDPYYSTVPLSLGQELFDESLDRPLSPLPQAMYDELVLGMEPVSFEELEKRFLIKDGAIHQNIIEPLSEVTHNHFDLGDEPAIYEQMEKSYAIGNGANQKNAIDPSLVAPDFEYQSANLDQFFGLNDNDGHSFMPGDNVDMAHAGHLASDLAKTEYGHSEPAGAEPAGAPYLNTQYPWGRYQAPSDAAPPYQYHSMQSLFDSSSSRTLKSTNPMLGAASSLPALAPPRPFLNDPYGTSTAAMGLRNFKLKTAKDFKSSKAPNSSKASKSTKTNKSDKVTKPKGTGPRVVYNRSAPSKNKACTNCASLKVRCTESEEFPGVCSGCLSRNTTESCVRNLRSRYATKN